MVTHPLGTEMYAVKHVAELLGLRTKTIYEAIEAGKLKAKKTGTQCLMTREAVREYSAVALVGFQGLMLTCASVTRKSLIRLVKNNDFKDLVGCTNRVIPSW
jgi:excisionase family DNA binding protein